MIGGEFEIDLSTRRDTFSPAPDTYYYASGRAALYQILKSIRGSVNKVWFPDWLCHTMIEATQKAGVDYEFYELNSSFMATTEALDAKGYRNGEIVVLINYFGLQDIQSPAKQIKEAYPQAIIIEDDVQAYYCFAEETNPFADYRFTSLRKTFAVPDGGLVYTKRPMPIAKQPNTFAKYKVEAGVMKAHRGEKGIKDEDYLALFEKGSKLIVENYESIMSRDSKMLWAGTDTQFVKKRRQENAKYLIDGLESIGIKTLIDVPGNKVPLFIPIWLEDRDDIRKKMFENEIYSPVHWTQGVLPTKTGANMARHELSIIIDQRYPPKKIKKTLQYLTNCKPH